MTAAKLQQDGGNVTVDPTNAAGIKIVGLNVEAGGRILLRDVDAEFQSQRVTLVVGPSGVGKSLLLKLIAGIIETSEKGIRHSGTVRVDGKQAAPGRVGVVFQSFAIFDELSSSANIEFARACGGKHASTMKPREILDRLRIPTGVPVSRLSGGQKQRLAIARTIAFNPPIIVYDEPTSGLDPSTGRQVADLIRETHDSFGETTVIVTHDYQSLVPIADDIFVLDPSDQSLKAIERSKWDRIPEMLGRMSQIAAAKDEQTDKPTLLDQTIDGTTRFFAGTTDVLAQTGVGLARLVPTWKTPWWGLRFLGHYARLVCGPTAAIYLILAGIIFGFVTTYFTFKFLPFASYTEPLLIEDLLTGLGFAMYRIFVPVLGCILIAARCGAAVTSDVGGRQYSNQIDALKTFGSSPGSYLLTPIIWSFLVGTPVLFLLCYFSARTTSLITFVNAYPARGPDFWFQNFHRGLDVVGQFWYRGTGWLLAKLLVSGFGVALISYFSGRRPKYSSTDVSRSITSTILLATLYVLVVHFLFSLFEFEGVVPGS